MELDLNTILNVVIGLALYNMIIKSIGMSAIKAIINSKHVEKERKDFKESLKTKLEDSE